MELKAGLLDHMQNVRVRSAIEMASGHPSYLGRMVAASLPQFDAPILRILEEKTLMTLLLNSLL